MTNRILGPTPGPTWIKIGTSVRYPQENLDQWIDEQIEAQTGNPSPKNTGISKASKRLLNEKEAAAYIGMSVAYLRRARLQGRVKVRLPENAA